MKLTQGIAFALIPSLVLAPSVRAAATAAPSAFVNDQADALLNEGSAHALTAVQYGALAVSLADSGKTDAAIVAAKLGLGVASNNREKAALMATLSLIWGSKKDFQRAAEAAQQGQEYLPNDPRLAALRVVYWGLAGDGVASLAAESHLMRLDPSFNRKPVFSVEDAEVWVKAAVDALAAYVAVTKVWEDLPPETRQAISSMIANILGAPASSDN